MYYERTEEAERDEEEEKKGEKAPDRQATPRGHSRLPGNALPRKLMPAKEKKKKRKEVFEYRSKSIKIPDRGFTSRCELNHAFNLY